MIIIGLTGSIAMGKSTISAQAKTLGVEVIDTDIMAKEILYQDQEIKEKFAESLNPVGQIDTKLMAQVVFANSNKLQQLEAIIYPKLTVNISKILQQYDQQQASWVIIDAPKLFESGLDKLCNYIITVDAPKEIQLARIRARGKYNEEQIKQIRANQMPNEEKIKRSDFKIETDEGLEYSLLMIKNILQKIRNT